MRGNNGNERTVGKKAFLFAQLFADKKVVAYKKLEKSVQCASFELQPPF